MKEEKKDKEKKEKELRKEGRKKGIKGKEGSIRKKRGLRIV